MQRLLGIGDLRKRILLVDIGLDFGRRLGFIFVSAEIVNYFSNSIANVPPIVRRDPSARLCSAQRAGSTTA